MAGRFFYRPPDPGYADLGAKIGGAVTQAADDFDRRKEDRRLRKRQETLDARAMERDDLQLDIQLAQLGGGRGAAPTQRTFTGEQVDFGEIERALPAPGAQQAPTGPRLDPSRWMRGAQPQQPGIGASTIQSGADLEFDPFDPIEHGLLNVEERTDPNMRNLAGGKFHIEDPEARRRRLAQEAQTAELGELDHKAGIETQERTTKIKDAARAIRARNPDLTPEQAEAEAALLVDEVANFDDLYSREPTRGTPEYEAMLGRERDIIERTRDRYDDDGASGSRGVSATSRFNQRATAARNLLDELDALDRESRAYGMEGWEVGRARQRLVDRYGMDEEAARQVILTGEVAAEEWEAGNDEEGLGITLDDVTDEADETDELPTLEGRSTAVDGRGGEFDAESGDSLAGRPFNRPSSGQPPRQPAAEAGAGAGADVDDVDTTPLTSAELNATRARLEGVPKRKWKERLKRAGFSDTHIDQVLTGSDLRPRG